MQPVVLRANSVKAQIADIEALKVKMEGKDEAILELKKQLKMKVLNIINMIKNQQQKIIFH